MCVLLNGVLAISLALPKCLADVCAYVCVHVCACVCVGVFFISLCCVCERVCYEFVYMCECV